MSVEKLAVAVDLLLAMNQRMAALSSIILAARTENRGFTSAEWAAIVQADDEADARLAQAIERAKAEGR